MKKRMFFVLVFMGLLPLAFADVILMKNGKDFSSIVLGKDASVVEKFAAEELSKYLGKIGKGTAPVISSSAVKGKYPIYLQVKKLPSLKEEGFQVSVKKNAMYITGREPVGVLYGVYSVLKKYAGIRWLIPGDEGEFYKTRTVISVPEKVWQESPSFAWRDFQVVCTGFADVPKTRLWGVRNNMRFHVSRHYIKRGKLEKTAPIQCNGGHSFSPLLHLHYTGNYKKFAKRSRDFSEMQFKKHPEYYPLVRGKRVKSFHGGNVPQPCTSNPEVIKIMGRELGEACRNMDKDHIFYLSNNDCTQWCECENCRKIDPPDEAKENLRATRYWTFARALLDEAQKICPDIKVLGSSYQNYSLPPTGTTIDKRVKMVSIANLRRCWKHALDDKNCPTNVWFYNYNKQWNDFKVPCRPYEMFGSQAAKDFMPNERKVVETLKFYKKNMPYFIGLNTEVCPPDGVYGKRWRTYTVLNGWRMSWQSMYLSAVFHWNVNEDYEKVYEEINSIFYGKGWAGGMREFRKELEKLYVNSAGCWGYGSSAPIGKIMDAPGAKEKLLNALAKAEKAAALDPDKRALANVKKDREFFEKIWLKGYEDYIKNYREIRLYPLQGKIKIDGKLNEADWRNADTYTRFNNLFKEGKPKHQTAVKLAYDKHNLYVGIEALEPLVNEMLTYYKKHDEAVWNDSNIELCINDPILGASFFKIMVNPIGTVADGIANPRYSKTWDSGAVVKTSKGKDRYFIEMKIPAKNIVGGTFAPGAVLRMNILRSRVIVNKKEETETSTWSMNGKPHNVDIFHAINFAPPRAVNKGSRAVLDMRAWKNGSFNEFRAKKKYPKHWKVSGDKLPASWDLSSSAQYGGEMEYLLHPGSKGNYFIRLKKGILCNKCKLKNDTIKASFRMKGNGRLRISLLRFTPRYKSKGTMTLKEFSVDSTDWKQFVFDYKRPGTKDEVQVIMLWPIHKKGVLDIDDFYLVPGA